MPLDTMPMEPKAEAGTPMLTGHGAKLVKITIALTDLIKQETELLKQRLAREAQKLHGQKNRLMAEYRETLNHLQVNEKLLGPKNSPARQYIRKITDKFREVLRDHARIVLRLKSVAEGIIKSVGEEVVKKNRPVVGYGKNAAFKTPAQMQPTSLQLNQVI
ncbi:hypothetical protein KFE96_12290 [Kordiimonas sp. SCSIO 12603]|uniref:hypothetical protein n=1 Tax=Kordiimonas sp. SCSIO 12603 TaxID=2829596 RepID=UPI002104AC18|nr:hypothetical protein [Kordiimonas sp. SCSIO 12603]UTW57615.1 hypothetical protein KFE96_12290 [Kordiimonas sp. SCSIO 12603]